MGTGKRGRKQIDLTGRRFGMLKVDCLDHIDENRNCVWRCKCECGGEKLVRTTDLRNRSIKSCGCLNSPEQKSIRAKEQWKRRGVPDSFVCKSCGKVIPNTSGAAWREYCDACAKERNRRVTVGDMRLSTGQIEKMERAMRPSSAKDGVFAGMTIAEINDLAREHHMSYGQFRAMCEARGYIVEAGENGTGGL